MNHFLEHYIKNQITPVKQDIKDLNTHFSRRTSLYKTLGVPPISFKNKKVLEIGPGGGYNPLVTQSFQLNKYDLLEANQYAIENINDIFTQYNVDTNNINIIHSMLEDFKTDETYDIIMCEGMIPGLDNKTEVLSKLDKLLSKDGVLIVTCADEVSYLFEILRHYIGSFLVNEEHTFDEKLDIFEVAFNSHLETLKGMSRFKRDWCADNLLGEMHFNYDFSIKEAISFFKTNYTFYNSSPNIFSDFRWYKSIPVDIAEQNEYFIDNFDKTKHNFLYHKTIYKQRDISKNNQLELLCKELFKNIKYSVVDKKDTNDKIVELLENIVINIEDLNKEDDRLFTTFKEIIKLIKNKDFTIDSVSNAYPYFKEAFGRGQSYVSLIKEC